MTTPAPTPPRLIDLLQRAAALINSEQPDIALPMLEEVLRADPANADALVLMGAALFTKQLMPEALVFLRRAIARRRGHADTLFLLAQVHDATGNHAMADNALRDLLAINPGHALAIGFSATRLSQAGKPEAALELLDRARRQGHGGPRIDNGIAIVCRALKRYADGIDAARRTVDDANAAPKERRTAWFLLGHLLDAEKRYDEAFDAFRRANNMQEAGEAIDARAAMRTWSADAIASIPAASHTSDMPVLVLGMPRSGTTITEQILLEHPLVESIGEADTLSRLCNAQAPAALDAAKVDAIHGAYTARLQRAAKKNTARVIDKMPENYLCIGFASRVLPGAKIVHCTRDARDTCLSNYFQDFGERITWSRRLDTCAAQFRAYRTLMDHFRNACGIAMLDWSNEALTQDPAAQIPALLDFVGLDRHDNCINFTGSSRRVRTASSSQVRDGVRAVRPPRWKNYEKHIGPLLESLADY